MTEPRETTAAADLARSTPHALQAGGGDRLDLAWPEVPRGAVLCVNLCLPAESEALMNSAWRHASPGEQARAMRFVDRRDAIRHLVARAALRRLLARHCGGQSILSEFAANAWGKPELPQSGFEFSISHSGSEIWLALTRSGSVGIDLEEAKRETPCGDLAGAFHPEEVGIIRNCAESELHAAFFRCWTRKESVIKAAGRGLSIPLDSFVVDTGAMSHGWLRRPPVGFPRRGGTTADLPVNAGYHGAVAATRSVRFSLWRHSFGNG